MSRYDPGDRIDIQNAGKDGILLYDAANNPEGDPGQSFFISDRAFNEFLARAKAGEFDD